MLDKKPSHRIRTTVTIVFSATILLMAGWLLLNREYAMDQVTVWAYKPSTSTQTVEENIKLTDKGTFYFHTGHPVVADAQSFNDNCPRREVGNPILGCYAMQRIYIYDVENPQLDGIKEVTAAHEMLHAAWDRLNETDKKQVSALLETTYTSLVDGELKERMAYYARTQPGEFHNELHSIIGTEMASLSGELETYYKRYFTDRGTIITYHNQYNNLFKSLQAQAETLHAELTDLGTSIATRTAQYNADSAQLSNDIADFNNRANNNGFSTLGQFNQERAALVARSDQLLSERDSINVDITLYNTKSELYREVAIHIESLNKSIDSIDALDPSPTL